VRKCLNHSDSKGWRWRWVYVQSFYHYWRDILLEKDSYSPILPRPTGEHRSTELFIQNRLVVGRDERYDEIVYLVLPAPDTGERR
jgi:hypothetical protein